MSFDTKYRPIRFEDVIGQKSAIHVLQELLRRGEVFQKSYVFAGPSGTGKTTTARILARAMLCENLDQATCEPCNTCRSCKQILERGDSPAFKEMDAANNTGADNVRKIVEGLDYYTLGGGDRKIYLIDECFTEDTELLTEEGLKSIRDIVETKYAGKVLSYDVATEEPVWRHITDWFDIPDERETLRLTFDNGAELEVTLDQELYTTNRGWVAARDLTSDDDICEMFLKGMSLPPDDMGKVYCACGCGVKIRPADARGRPRLFKGSHGGSLSKARQSQIDSERKASQWDADDPNCGCGCGRPLIRTSDQLRTRLPDLTYLPGHNQRNASVANLTSHERMSYKEADHG